MRHSKFLSGLTLAAILSCGTLLTACKQETTRQPDKAVAMIKETERLNAWFAARYEDWLARTPMNQTYFGSKKSHHRLDDSSALAQEETAALTRTWLTELRGNFDYNRLSDEAKLSYRLYEFDAEDQLAVHKFADHEYVFQHMNGPHSDLPSFLINFHEVDDVRDAKAYISRLIAFPHYLGGFMARAEAQFDNNVRLPAFVYPKLSEASRNVITGAPFTDGEDSPLFADIKNKINGLKIDEGQKSLIIAEARAALLEDVQPAYLDLLKMFARHAEGANEDDGVWKLPDGEAFYQSRLTHYTSTELTAAEIHEIGLKDVARIQDEMRVIMKQTGFEGDLQAFYTFLRTDEQFTYSNDDAGRAAYIERATRIIEEMKGQLDSLFITQPKSGIVVKRVEPFREASAFGAFYEQPAVDGSRPGTYYINLKDMSELPIYQMQALAYHEGIPGHHMQIAIAMELEGLPRFRTLGGHTPYIEGWALYAESIPKELGLYTDPYQDFGRLSMEIFRAARLVVDTGIHSMKWAREDAVEYMMANTANSEGDIRAEVDRYIVWPGQATAYKIGMIKIGDLKTKAQNELGENFDIRAFHDVLLANGSVPLGILEELVDNWIAETKDKS